MNYATRAWKKDLNIEVTYDWVDSEQATYDTKLNMAIASNTMPDAFKCNYIQYRQLMQADLIQDITDAYNNYTSQRIRDYEKADPDTIKLSSKDGRIYGIPGYYYGIIDNPRLLWVRNDWYKATGSPQLKTVEDFENLAKESGPGISVRNVRTAINQLTKLEFLTHETTNRFTQIFVINYDKYQSQNSEVNNQKNKQVNNQKNNQKNNNRTKQQGNKNNKIDDDIYTRARKLLDLERQRNVDAYQGNPNVEKAFDKLERIIKTVPMTESVLNNMDKAIAIACHYWIENEHDGIVYPVAYIKSVLTGENDDI